MADNVILVGFMGAGKSSVGRLLARRLGRCFVETDDMIVAREGCSIPTIFATHGEEYFRAAGAGGGAAGGGGGGGGGGGRGGSLYARAQRAGERPMLAGRTRADAEA